MTNANFYVANERIIYTNCVSMGNGKPRERIVYTNFVSLGSGGIKEDMLPSNFAPKNKKQKELTRSIDRFVNSEAFESGIDNAVSTMAAFVDNVLKQSNVEVNMRIVPTNLDTKDSVRDATYVEPAKTKQ